MISIRHWAVAAAIALLAACGGGEPSEEPSVEAPPDRSDSRVRMGLALISEGLFDAGMEQFHRLAENPEQRLRPGNEPAWAPDLLKQLLRRRRLALADSLLQAAGPFEGLSPELRYASANLASLRGDDDEALRRYATIDGEPQLMLRVHHEMATLHLLADRPAEAIESARAGLAIAPEQQSLRILVAEAQRRQGRVEEALRTLGEVPAGADRWVAEGELFLNSLDRPDTAAVLLENALRISPSIPNVRYLLGRALLESGNAERAVKAFRPLASRQPPFEESRRLLAESYRASGRDARADSLQRVLEAAESHEELLDLRRRGLEASQSGDLEKALDRFGEALEIAPGHANLHNDRGAVLARLERWEEAEQAFLEASRLAPEDPTSVQNLARLYHRTGEIAARDSALARWRLLTLPDSTATVDND